MATPKKRIPVNGPQTGLNAAFSGLHIDGLQDFKPAPEKPSVPEHKASFSPGRVVLRRSTARRGGKTVLVVDGFGPHHCEEAIGALGRRLRAALGCGGTVHERVWELQGDQPSKVRAFLEAEGFQVAGER